MSRWVRIGLVVKTVQKYFWTFFTRGLCRRWYEKSHFWPMCVTLSSKWYKMWP